MLYVGAILLVAAMVYALYVLFTGMRDGSYNYFGRKITRAQNPVAFWFVMAVMVGCMLLGARTLPLYIVALS